MIQFALPLALLLGSFYTLGNREAGPLPKAGPAKQPDFPPEVRAALLEQRPNGFAFKVNLRSGILRSLALRALEEVPIQGGEKGRARLYRVIPAAPGLMNASVGLSLWQSRGFSVLGSLSLSLANAEGADQLLLVTGPSDAPALTGPLSQFALLAEPMAKAAEAPAPTPATPVAPAFDAHLPHEIANDIARDLVSEENVIALRSLAGELGKRGFPLAEKTVRQRADTLELRQKLAEAKSGGVSGAVRPARPVEIVEMAEPTVETPKTETNGVSSHAPTTRLRTEVSKTTPES